ncbi:MULTISPECIES: hypothetical protein [unclassified Nitratiruptor]|uniref:hypothetical protein n=1 Tax=unclassified Nitratiruptor TaxID=2624044 RepID=UPI0019153AB2|nr:MULTISPECIES: hypothetical protein [unclassified Nitratiruptor]BCD59685.1 hypothetical protein NitYY0810_C0437 [Nitratiruptor sp. YY08-10]BCD63609.1 hypothetical protein NitYY0814_C0437 [Nitratiruptor sp. YY08-14]
MTFEELWKILSSEIVKRINNHNGLGYFAKNRAKFEGWLKVEICDILSKYTTDIVPEKDRIDIVFDNWALELKTANTNYHYNDVVNKTRPITKNIQSIIKDIKDLRKNSTYIHKAVLFIVFPLSKEVEYWDRHILKIENELQELREKEFRFKNAIPAILYCGLV